MNRPATCRNPIRPWAVWACLLCAAWGVAQAREVTRREDLWSLQPIVRPALPAGTNGPSNPIDAFLAEECRETGVVPLGPADAATWLRRVTLDLTGLPPAPAEIDAFLKDPSPGASAAVVERLLSSEQHGVRFGRLWLDVLRYADVDEGMPAAPGIHLWRDWVIRAISSDMPYDAFVRAQICGHRSAERTTLTATGHRVPVPPRPDDLFALGFLARGAASRADADQQLAMSAVETISTAFLGMTVGCAKCHDHFFDPIRQADFYSMKALFDPLVLRPVELATVEQRVERGRAQAEYEAKRAAIEGPMNRLIDPYRTRLYDERVSMLPKEVQVVIRKRPAERSKAEAKIADDYYPILRIDPPKIKEIMPKAEVRQYDEYQKELNAIRAPASLPVFWTVEEDSGRLAATNYVLTTGDPTRPRLSQPVKPGFPFAPPGLEFREGRREGFVDWLTSAENPLFARVAVNRIWQWHFGSGLHGNPGDFGTLGGKPLHPRLLDWLSSEFVAQGYSMKWLHRLIVTSDAYRRASASESAAAAANARKDPDNRTLWRFPLRRLDAECVRDSLLTMAGSLDTSTGGASTEGDLWDGSRARRAIYISRGYRSSGEVLPEFFRNFDVEDGRTPCLVRGQTVTAPQALFLMNSAFSDRAATQMGERLRKESGGDCARAVELGYTLALGRTPSDAERRAASEYLHGDVKNLDGLAWMLLNLDEFLYVR